MRLPEDPQVGDVWKSTAAYLATYVASPKEAVYLLVIKTPHPTSVNVIEVPEPPYITTHPIDNLFIRRWFTRIHKGNASEY